MENTKTNKALDWNDTIQDDGDPRKPAKTEQQKNAEQQKARDAVEAHKQTPAGSPAPETGSDAGTSSGNLSLLMPITISDCLKYPAKLYILDGIIEVGDIVLFSGSEKIGKTHCLMNMAMCMAGEVPWLGDIETMQDVKGNVLWLDCEMKEEAIKRRINMAYFGLKAYGESNNQQITQDILNHFFCLNGNAFRNAGLNAPNLFTPDNAVTELQLFIQNNNVKICFLDNLVKVEGDTIKMQIIRIFHRLKLA